MTQPQTMTVEQTEILARANELESPIADPPNLTAKAPCGLEPAVRASTQLGLSLDNMKTYLAAGATERGRLATSMRNAAKAYGAVDEEAATTMNNNGGAISSESIGDSGTSAQGLQDTQNVGASGAGYMDVKDAAAKIEQPDQAVSMANLADAWANYNLTLQQSVQRFRGFSNWTGDAATAVKQSMDQQKEWLLYMAKLSNSVAQQARYMADLHNYAYKTHPRLADVTYVENGYKTATDDKTKTEYLNMYMAYQKTSEDVQGQYTSKALLDPINPPDPPPAVKINPPPAPQQQGLIPSQVMSAIAGGQGGSTPSMPSMPSMGGGAGSSGGAPSGGGAALTGAHGEAAHAPGGPGGGSMKPMSAGGGGAAPAMPLAPAGDGVADPSSVRPAAASDAGAAGRAGAGAGGAMGGGGGMPMGGHGQGAGGSKTKGSQQDDEALYTEDRAWTEAVIGNRRRQDSKEGK
jgi:hypothetical protein